jgi:hypothetical protein
MEQRPQPPDVGKMVSLTSIHAANISIDGFAALKAQVSMRSIYYHYIRVKLRNLSSCHFLLSNKHWGVRNSKCFPQRPLMCNEF